MRYNKNMMNDVIDDLICIREYDYINYPNEDEAKADEILKNNEKYSERICMKYHSFIDRECQENHYE